MKDGGTIRSIDSLHASCAVGLTTFTLSIRFIIMGKHEENNDSSSSSSSSSSDIDESTPGDLELRLKDKKRHRRSRRDHRRGEEEDDDEDDDPRRSSKKSHKKSSSLKKKKTKRRRRRRDYDSDSDSSSSAGDDGSSSDSSSYDRRRRRKEKKKKDKKRHKKSRRHKRSSSSRSDEGNKNNHRNKDDLQDRNYALADALHHLMEHHPDMGADLPIILVRLAVGTTFDLRNMPPPVGHALAAVLRCLAPFGVAQQDGGTCWAWESPTGKSSHTNTNELVLVRIVRAMLDQIGLTMEAMEEFENPTPKETRAPPAQQQTQKSAVRNTENQKGEKNLEDHVKRILDSFDTNTLGTELAGLCTMILDGESIALDGLPDPTLRTALEGLLQACGLVQAEMEPDEGDDDEAKTDNGPSLGYALPEDHVEHTQECLSRVKRICETIAARPPRIHGPKRPPTSYRQSATHADHVPDDDDEDDEIGPSVVPREETEEDTARARVIEAQAARRQRELAHVAAGGEGPLPPDEDHGGREEWMTTPGKAADFFDFVKRGEPMKSRKFQGKAKDGGDDDDDVPIDPAVQAEMDAIYEAHATARGPSLMEEHQAAKKAAQQAAAAEDSSNPSTKSSWKWSRNQDLDAGRRVDTDALQMVLGGAATGLKTKFQGGFRGAR